MRRFEESDIPMLNGWYKLRKMVAVTKDMLPDIGFIVDNVAAGFIYKTDSLLCFIDGYVSNPAASMEDKDEAFDKITDSLLLAAKEHGFSCVLAYTQHPAIEKRCHKHQFKFKGQYALYVKGI